MRMLMLAGAWSLALIATDATAQRPAQIEFTQIARCGAPGEAGGRDTLSGVVRDTAQPQAHRVVLYAFSGDSWWVQPWANAPLTNVQSNGAWSNVTFHGVQYAALLVRSDYTPASRAQALPVVGGQVLAAVSAPCRVARN